MYLPWEVRFAKFPGMKKCSRCKQEKDETEFYPDRTKASGYSSQCRQCRSEWGQKYRQDEKVVQAARERVRAWHLEHKEEESIRRKKAYKPEDNLNRNLKRLYGISLTEFRDLESKQDGRCLICKRKPKAPYRLVVDHDHKTGQFRGLVCAQCNLGLGAFADDPEALRSAADYLEKNNVHLRSTGAQNSENSPHSGG
jgi:hypothetical protein